MSTNRAVDVVVCRSVVSGDNPSHRRMRRRRTTRFRLMNAVPDESSLDLLVDSTSVSSDLAYGTSTGYQTTKSGSHQVAIEPSGSSTALLQQSITFASGSDTTIISSNFSLHIANLVLTDDNSAPASGNFKIRVVNASPGLGPADVYIVAPGLR